MSEKRGGWRCLTTSEWKLEETDRGSGETLLVHLVSDLGELNNAASEHSEKRAELSALLQEENPWLDDT